jgi:hypothetical protein
MFDDPQSLPDETKRQRSWEWSGYANNLLLVAAVFGGLGMLLFGLSLLGSPPMPKGTRGAALGDLTGAAIATGIGLWWRWRRRSAQ